MDVVQCLLKLEGTRGNGAQTGEKTREIEAAKHT